MTLVVVVSVKVVFVMLSVKRPKSLGGGGNSAESINDEGVTAWLSRTRCPCLGLSSTLMVSDIPFGVVSSLVVILGLKVDVTELLP